MKFRNKLNTKELILCSLFSALIAIGAFINIPVPFMDYFTLQFLFVILAGIILGPKLGAISVITYVFIGLTGFPIFAAGGGIQYIFRPSFGYLLGFIECAFIVGLICKRFINPTFKHYLWTCLVGMFVTYITGFAYKYLILNIYMHETTPFGVIVLSAFPIDIPGDIALCFAGAFLATRLKNILNMEILQC